MVSYGEIFWVAPWPDEKKGVSDVACMDRIGLFGPKKQ